MSKSVKPPSAPKSTPAPGAPKGRPPGPDDARDRNAARAEALRANLARRKQSQRQRADNEPGEPQ